MPKTSGGGMREIRGEEGNWLLIVDNVVVASDSDCKAIFELSEKYAKQDVIITKVLSPNASFY